MAHFSPLLGTLLLAGLPLGAALAQTTGGVGIGTTAPDASAALDVVSSGKGALLPRLTAAQRLGIASPAPGLLVYQTDAPTAGTGAGTLAGFYYNAGTAAAPSWQQLATAAVATSAATNGLTKTGNSIGLGGTLTQATTIAQGGNALTFSGGNVGIRAASPAQPLVVQEPDGSYLADIIKAQSFNQASAVSLYYQGLRASGTNTNDPLSLDAKGTGALALNASGGTGNVGIGTTTPTQKLDVNGTARIGGAALVSTDVAVDANGANTGTTANMLRFGSNTSGEGLASKRTSGGNQYGLDFYTASANRLSITINGGVGIGTTTPNAAAVLDVTSTTQGVLLPRLTQAQRNALGTGSLAAPVAGLLIYQTDNTPGLYAYDGTTWVRLGADNLGNHLATQPLNMQGNALVGNGANIGGIVGIGVRADGGLNMGQNGGQNVLVGFSAGPALTTGSANVLVGPGSGQSLTVGRLNTFSGYQSGGLTTEGRFNVFGGYRSGYGTTTGNTNTFSGYQSGINNTDGSDNTALGANSGPVSGSLTNATALGANVSLTQSNTVVLGNGARVGIGTSAPGHPLTVQSNTDGLLLGFNDASGTDKYNFSRVAPSGSGSTAVPGGLNLSESNVASGRLYVQDGTGNVGVGTAAPNRRLVVQEANNSYLADIIKAQSFNQASAVSLYYQGLRASGNNTNDPLYLDSKGTGVLALNASSGTGNVGIGTTTPGARLEVNGQVKLTGGNPGAGKVLTSDANGLATWETVGGATTANSIQNQTATAQAAGFNISGAGTVGGLLTASGGATITGATSLNTMGTSDTRIGGNPGTVTVGGGSGGTTIGGGSGAVTIGGGFGSTIIGNDGLGTVELGHSGSIVKLANLGAGVVQAAADGTLSSSSATAAFGNSFIQNQTSAAQPGGFYVSGSGQLNGGLYVQNGVTIDGNILASTGNINLGNSGKNTSLTGSTLTLTSGSSSLGFSSSGTTLNSSGNLSLSTSGQFALTTSQGGSLTMTSTGASLQGSGSNGLFFRNSGSNELYSAGNTLSLTTPTAIIPSGNLGVGNSAPNSRLHVSGSVALPLTTTAAALGLSAAHYTVRCASGCTQLTLPDATTCAGRLYVLINLRGNTSGPVTLTPTGTQIIVDDTQAGTVTSLPAGSRLTIQSDGSNWYVLSR